MFKNCFFASEINCCGFFCNFLCRSFHSIPGKCSEHAICRCRNGTQGRSLGQRHYGVCRRMDVDLGRMRIRRRKMDCREIKVPQRMEELQLLRSKIMLRALLTFHQFYLKSRKTTNYSAQDINTYVVILQPKQLSHA